MRSIFRIGLFTLCFSHCLHAQTELPMVNALKNNDLLSIDSLILNAEDENISFFKGAHIFMWACMLSNVETVAHLYNTGLYTKENYGYIPYENENFSTKIATGVYGTPLSIAAGEDNVKLLEFLNNSLAPDLNEQVVIVDKPEASEWTAFMHAVNNESGHAIKWLLEAGATLDLKNKEQKSVFDLTEDVILHKVLNDADLTLLEDYNELVQTSDTLESCILQNDFEGFKENAKGIEESYLRLYKDNYTLGLFYNGIGQGYVLFEEFEIAKEYYLKGIHLVEKINQTNGVVYSVLHHNLSIAYQEMGNNSEALQYSQKALEIERANGNQSYISMNSLALLYSKLEQKEKAIELLLEGIDLADKNEKALQIHREIFRLNLAQIYIDVEQFEKADSIFKRFQAFTLKEYGKKHQYYAHAINSLGSSYLSQNRNEEALHLVMESLEIAKEVYGETHSTYGIRLNNVGAVNIKLGNYQQAIQYLEPAKDVFAQVYGVLHHEYLAPLKHLALSYQKLGDIEKAKEIYQEVTDNIRFNLKHRLPYLPIDLQISWKQKFDDRIGELASFYLDYDLPLDMYLCISQLKNFTLNPTVVQDQEDATFVEWIQLKKQIGIELVKPDSLRNEALADWQSQAFKLESAIQGNKDHLKDYDIDLDYLKNSLEEDEIVIDIHHVKYHKPEATDSIVYIAYLYSQDENKVKQIKLCYEHELKKTMNYNGERKADYTSTLYNSSERGLNVNTQAKSLYALVWKPLLSALEGKKTIHISSSGLLNEINLGAIAIEEDTRVIDSFTLKYFTSLRHKTKPSKKNQNKTFMLIGGLNFNTGLEINESDSNEQRQSSQNDWKPLKWTKVEIEKINASFQNDAAWKGTSLLEEKGKEETIKELLNNDVSPQVLHFATHAYFFDDQNKTQNNFASSSNPMIRTGLILSGANQFWMGKQADDWQEDGMLTAYEIQNINLSETELVVLSACETGLGTLKGSEGVFGLQRAFKMAGAKYIIMSLWQVPDRETSDFMVSFYDHWLNQSMSIEEAFRQTQLDMKDRFYNPYQWAGFVLLE